MRAGYGRSLFQPLLPIILGRDVSAEVADVGSSVKSLHVGQEVFGALHPTAVRGTYADYVILSEGAAKNMSACFHGLAYRTLKLSSFIFSFPCSFLCSSSILYN